MASTPNRDPVAVLISQASFRLQWLLDRRSGAPWSDRGAGREFEDNTWRASRRETLARLNALGIQPDLLSSPMVEAGALERDGIKVLLLPNAIALSDAELTAIRAFAGRGGTVLADTEPGLFDGHLRRRPALPLSDIAPVSEAIMRRGGVPDAPLLDGEADLLTSHDAGPRARFLALDGTRATGIEARWLRHGNHQLLSIQAVAPNAAANRITVELAQPAVIRDLRTDHAIATGARFTIELDPAEPSILDLSVP